MQLSNLIREYYFTHYDELTAEKKFHFSSRLYAFEGDSRAKESLQNLKLEFLNQDHTKELRSLLLKTAGSHINAFEKREPYFKKYPTLYGIELGLFYVRHALFVYGIDLRPQFSALVSSRELKKLIDTVLGDAAAISALSTYIVNVAYLCSHLFDIQIERAKLTKLDKSQTFATPDDIKLFIYLYTHCIIGATNFYVQAAPDTDHDLYLQLLHNLEECIGQYFEQISLDNKLEFLVCCRICDYTSPLEKRIREECDTSLSNKGDFLIDTHNSYAGKTKQDVAGSEHRNVLFIMSSVAFKPHGQII